MVGRGGPQGWGGGGGHDDQRLRLGHEVTGTARRGWRHKEKDVVLPKLFRDLIPILRA